MDRNAWVSHYQYGAVFNPFSVDPLSDVNDKLNKDTISIDFILPDDLLEKILANLPIASIFRASCVCKKWHKIVISKHFLRSLSSTISSQKPWYFMFTNTDECSGYSYDPTLKWYSIDLPYFVTSNWFKASSCGLVCFMNNDTNEFHVCNPITKFNIRLVEPSGITISDYAALAISVNKTSLNYIYTVSMVKSKQVPDYFYEWDISIHVYSSKTMSWLISSSEVLTGWRAGEESVICNGALYFLLYSVGGGFHHGQRYRHGLIKYKLSNRASQGGLMSSFILAPCSMTCGRLMNLKERLVMVGGIGKKDRSDIIKGIGIWVLNKTEWEEVAQMPRKYFQGFGEFDDVFASSGTEDIIYIQSYGSPALLLFDMNSKQWKWSQRCPVTKKFPLQLFNGFCFEPRLDPFPQTR